MQTSYAETEPTCKLISPHKAGRLEGGRTIQGGGTRSPVSKAVRMAGQPGAASDTARAATAAQRARLLCRGARTPLQELAGLLLLQSPREQAPKGGRFSKQP